MHHCFHHRDKIANKVDEESAIMFPKFRRLYNRQIIKTYRKTPIADPFFADVPTFPEFIDYLVQSPVKEYNEHWMPYHLTCDPCALPYVAILKLETLEDDSRTLVDITGSNSRKSTLLIYSKTCRLT